VANIPYRRPGIEPTRKGRTYPYVLAPCPYPNRKERRRMRSMIRKIARRMA
jgi:hypothetical protein